MICNKIFIDSRDNKLVKQFLGFLNYLGPENDNLIYYTEKRYNK